MLHAIVLDADSRERELTIAACRASDIHVSGWAASGSTGLDLLESLPRTPDLIIAELRLADMDAADLIQALALLAPRSSLLICSRCEPRLRDAAFTLARALGLSTLPAVPKPLEPATLRRALALLEPPRAPPRPAPAMTVDADELLRALRRGEFELHYQPKVALDGMRVRGAEGLLRWRHPVHGLLGPGSFLRQVQGAGLLEALTLTTLDLVLADWHGLQARGLALPLSLNLSASLLADPHLAASLIETVDHAGVPPAMLSFEITEDTELADMTAALRVLLKLRLHGFGLSLDDYGSGFSSLMRLSRIPFTELKIDRSLVHEACSRPHLLPLLRSVVRLASELGIEAVAEGVESAADLEVLKALGCHQVQGYFLARPMPALDLARLLAEWHRG
jgi:EAL domain-containing protein (putative c-di-GMP-specific phosphodiesterase class I)/CheY-like chemotaxis protein